MPTDVVVVSYNSAAHLRRCVQPLVGDPEIHVVVVDNASSDTSLGTLEDLAVETVALASNGGFAVGCNAGWRAGRAPYVVFLNPDAVSSPEGIKGLARTLAEDEGTGAVAPKILEPDGSVAPSQRRFPRLRSTWARAFFVHRIVPRAGWTDELVRVDAAYDVPARPDWVSGACVAVRRRDLERLGGLDETFFMYREDVDLCLRLRQLGLSVRYEPSVVVEHVGGASAPHGALTPVLASSRIAFARKHWSPAAALLERLGVAAEALTHTIVSRGGLTARAGHCRALLVALTGTPARPT